jgi:hypothetical protein
MEAWSDDGAVRALRDVAVGIGQAIEAGATPLALVQERFLQAMAALHGEPPVELPVAAAMPSVDTAELVLIFG